MSSPVLFDRGISVSLAKYTDITARPTFKIGPLVPIVNVLNNVANVIGLKKSLSATVTGDRQVVARDVDTTKIKDLRIEFRIEKHLGKTPNECEVTIYNLSRESRIRFQEKPLHLRLDAGYNGVLEHLYEGDVRHCESRHVGTEWETRLLLGDGDRAFRFARVSRSFKRGVKVRAALQEAATSMGLTLPDYVTDSQLAGEYVSGLSLHGAARDEMTRLLAPLGLEWSIQNGRLQILNPEAARPGEILVISQSTGMIEAPEYGAPETKKKPRLLTVRTLLKPALLPGALVRVESENIRGTFKVVRVTHTGDTHGPEWISEFECRQIKAGAS